MDVANYIVSLISKTVKEQGRINEPRIVYGEVTHVNPLKVMVNGSYEIDEDFMVIDQSCRHTVIKIPTESKAKHLHRIQGTTKPTSESGTFEGTIGGAPATGSITLAPHTHDIDFDSQEALPEILLWRGLKVGDKVKIIRFQGGAIHWITGRVDSFTNEGQVKTDETIDANSSEEQQ